MNTRLLLFYVLCCNDAVLWFVNREIVLIVCIATLKLKRITCFTCQPADDADVVDGIVTLRRYIFDQSEWEWAYRPYTSCHSSMGERIDAEDSLKFWYDYRLGTTKPVYLKIAHSSSSASQLELYLLQSVNGYKSC